MTVKTKKILVALCLCLVLAITVTLGVFCLIPNFSLNGFGDFYQSPLTVIQKSMAFTDKVKSTYTIELDDDNVENRAEKIDNVVKSIRSRLSKTYGYYGSDVSYDKENDTITVTIPQSCNANTSAQPSAATILSNVIVNGKVEILTSEYSGGASYSEDNVLLTKEHFKRATVRSYLNNEQNITLYICRVRLTKEGKKLAEQLVENTAYTCAVDGNVETWVFWTGNELQITYAYSEESTSEAHARAMAAYIGSDMLEATLTQEDSTEIITNKYGWIYLAVFGALVLASFVYFAVRFKGLCVIPIMTQLLAIFIFMFFGALVHLELFNVSMAVGVLLSYAFMSFFSAFTFEKIRKFMNESKTYSWARFTAFKQTNILSLIAHGALLVLGVILWVIPTGVTAPLGNAFVYSAILSFAMTFGANRLCALMAGPFFEEKTAKSRTRK